MSQLNQHLDFLWYLLRTYWPVPTLAILNLIFSKRSQIDSWCETHPYIAGPMKVLRSFCDPWLLYQGLVLIVKGKLPANYTKAQNAIVCLKCARTIDDNGKDCPYCADTGRTTGKTSIILMVIGTVLLFWCCTKPSPVTPTPSSGGMNQGGTVQTTGGSHSGGFFQSTGGTIRVVAFPPCQAEKSSTKTYKLRPLGRLQSPVRLLPKTPYKSADVRDVLHKPRVKLNQGKLGACTTFSSCHSIAIFPQFAQLTNADAIKFYKYATTIDPFPGQYPPTDTGSDGISALNSLIHYGLIKSQTPCVDREQARQEVQSRACIFGTSWTNDMFFPDQCGHVKVGDLSKVNIAGGHEVAYVGLELATTTHTERDWFFNSWDDDWGLCWEGICGWFFVEKNDTERLQAEGATFDCANVE